MGVFFLLFALCLRVSLFVDTALAHVNTEDTSYVADGRARTAGRTSNEVRCSMELRKEERILPIRQLEPMVEPPLSLMMTSEQTRLYNLIKPLENLGSAFARLKQLNEQHSNIRGLDAYALARLFLNEDCLPAFRKFALDRHREHADAKAIEFLELRFGSKLLAQSLREANMSPQGQALEAAKALEQAQFEKWRNLKGNPRDIVKVKLGVEDPDKLEGLEKDVKDEFMKSMDR